MHTDRTAAILSFANRNFNQGLRAYYFGVAALSWFLHPALMIAMTLYVAGVSDPPIGAALPLSPKPRRKAH